jgi:predicted lipoprotein with Yx(FWY)xxD motif
MGRFRLAALVAVVLAGAVVAATALGAPARTEARAVVKVAFNKKLKTSILVDGKGRTLYMFTEDPPGKATCAAADPACPTLWPAYATTGKPAAGAGIKASLLGTTKGAKGVTQVVYNRHPLYYWAGYGGLKGDTKPGQVNGQGFYGVWYVLSPKGTKITTPLKS